MWGGAFNTGCQFASGTFARDKGNNRWGAFECESCSDEYCVTSRALHTQQAQNYFALIREAYKHVKIHSQCCRTGTDSQGRTFLQGTSWCSWIHPTCRGSRGLRHTRSWRRHSGRCRTGTDPPGTPGTLHNKRTIMRSAPTPGYSNCFDRHRFLRITRMPK